MAFKGKVAIVTGGGSGMGRLEALKLANTGAEVALFDMNEKGMEETKSNLPNIHCFKCDLSDNQQVDEQIARVEQQFGPVDRITHAAGIMPASLMAEETADSMHRMMNINYGGTINVMTNLLPKMIKRDSGDLIVFGSSAGYCPAPRLGAYCSSKAAVNYLLEIAYYENLKSNVRIMLVAPPIVNTPLLNQAPSVKGYDSPKTKKADPQEIIDAIERDIEKGNMVCWGNFSGKLNMLLHKWAPNFLWNMILKMEGLN